MQNLFHGQLDFKEFGPFLFFFVMLMGLLQYNPKRAWIIIVAAIGCIYGFVTSMWMKDMQPVLLRDKYAAMKHPVKLISFQYQEDMQIPFMTVFVGAAKVAFVAVLETLISARIADNMTGTHYNQSTEVRGLAYANILSGVMGGLPCTGVLIRTAVNAQSGATDKMSQFINAMVVLVFALVLMPAFSFIPMSIVASILITSSCRLVPKKFIYQTFVADKFECALIIITTAACVLIDGALGLLIGSFIALLHHAVKSATPVIETSHDDDFTRVTVSGNVDFLNAADFELKVMNVWENSENDVIVTLKQAKVFDFDALMSVQLVAKQVEANERKQRLVFVLDEAFVNKGSVDALLKSTWYTDNKDSVIFTDEETAAEFLLTEGIEKEAEETAETGEEEGPADDDENQPDDE